MASWFTVNRTIGTGGSWWDLSVSAWGEDAMRGHDVAVTRGGVVINGDQAAKQKQKQQNQKQNKGNKSKSKKLTNTKTFESIQFSFYLTAEIISQTKNNSALVVCYGALHWDQGTPLPYQNQITVREGYPRRST